MRYVTLLALAVTSTAARAQDFPFPDSAALWVQSYYYMVVPPPFPVFELGATANLQVNGEDTLINSLSYSKLTDVVDGTYYGALRDDGGRVWHVPVDSIQEFLLYDFTANTGDTLEVMIYPGFPGVGTLPGIFELVVQNVYYDPDHEGRRTMDFIGGGLRWFEGIGCEMGLLAEPWPNVSNYGVALECMSHLDTIRHMLNGLPAPGTCAPLVMGTASSPIRSHVHAYPNPTTGKISVPLPGTDITLTDAQGRTWQPALTRRADRTELDLSAVPDGIYVLRLRDGDMLRTERMVKMH